LVLRGYGDDEWRVHGLLTPGVPVVVAAERAVGLVTARREQCDCAVLDDAFQHRQVARLEDVVLVSADAWQEPLRLLPSGPYREPLESLNRASVAVITVKAASADTVQVVRAAIRRAAPSVPIAQLRLAPGGVRLAATIVGNAQSVPHELQHDMDWLRGRETLLVSAIADPDAFGQQMAAAGAVVRHHAVFPDHHAFGAGDVSDIVARAGPSVAVVCTLKDAVKLVPLWPRAGAALWYLSQTVVVEQGAEILEQVVARVLAARRATTPTAG
jgi:tetraacyldisaccharide 4'-kinase